MTTKDQSSALIVSIKYMRNRNIVEQSKRDVFTREIDGE